MGKETRTEGRCSVQSRWRLTSIASVELVSWRADTLELPEEAFQTEAAEELGTGRRATAGPQRDADDGSGRVRHWWTGPVVQALWMAWTQASGVEER